jgi:hypothetical protein
MGRIDKMKALARRATVIEQSCPLLLVFNPVNPAHPVIVSSCFFSSLDVDARHIGPVHRDPGTRTVVST